MGTYNYSARELANEIGNLLNNLEGDFTLDELKKALRFVAAEHSAQRTVCTCPNCNPIDAEVCGWCGLPLFPRR